MRWIVGIDFKGRCAGALELATWLQQHAQVDGPQELTAVHVLSEQVRRLLSDDARPGLEEGAMAQLQRVIASHGARLDPRLQWAASADEGIALAAASPDITGILIGRATPRTPVTFERLGRAARRLLRRLPAPVMVVPPDLQAAQIGGGPIVLATDLADTSLPAARLARDLARRLDRELVALHVDSSSYDAAMLAPEALAILSSLPKRTLEDVERWVRAHELVSADAQLASGERISTILDTARAHEAALIVCGSRGLDTAQRLFASSTGSELARRADRPVLVVPHG